MIAINKDKLISEIKGHAERMDNKRNTTTNYAYQLAHTHIIELIELIADYDGLYIPDP